MPSLTIHGPVAMQAHAQKVLNGEYDIPYEHSLPTVLDVGANIGSYAIWASQRWLFSTIYCYEPLSDNFELLKQNTAVLGSRVVLHPFAIGNPRHTKLRLGKNNCGEASFFDLGEQREETVTVITKGPEVLPDAQILKLDVEGAEVEILMGIPDISYDAVVLEYHSDYNRRMADQLLYDYVLVECHGGQHRGIVKYLHKRLV